MLALNMDRFRPKGAAPVGPGHRGQLARLIRERPVSVNCTLCRFPDFPVRPDCREYCDFAVFSGGTAALFPGGRGRTAWMRATQTLAICNLTGSGAGRILNSSGSRQDLG